MSEALPKRMPERFNKFLDDDLFQFNRIIAVLLDPEQLSNGEKLAQQLLEFLSGQQRGAAVFSLLLVAQIVCEQWRDERMAAGAAEAASAPSKYFM